jgi:phosphatidate cytidylyltransferase
MTSMRDFAVLFSLYLGCIAFGLVLRFGSSVLRGDGTRKEKSGAGIAAKLPVFFVFQALLLVLSWAWPTGLFLFLLTLSALAVVEVAALHPARAGTGAALLAFSLPALLALSAIGFFVVARSDGTRILVPLALLLAAVFDGFSQIVGELAGGPRLAPRVSPAKTWSGLCGGAFFAACAALLARWLLFPGAEGEERAGYVVFMLFALAVGLAALAGDLSASAVKRRLGVKDFSARLGAQGGVLDRTDSLLALGIFLWAAHPFVASMLRPLSKP